MLSLPKLPASVGRAKRSALSDVSRAQRSRLARRLAAQLARRAAAVEPLTPAAVEIPAWSADTTLVVSSSNAAALPDGIAWLRALLAHGWLAADKVGEPQNGEALFALVAQGVRAMLADSLAKVEACLPENLTRYVALEVQVDALQALHEGLCGGTAASEARRLSVTVAVCGAPLIEIGEPQAIYERVLRGAWNDMAKAMGRGRMHAVSDGLMMCNPMLEEMLTDLLNGSQVVDGKRLYDPAAFEVFADEMGYDIADPEIVQMISAQADELAAFRESAAQRKALSPRSKEARAWLATAPTRQVDLVRSFARLTKLVSEAKDTAAPGDCEGLTGGAVMTVEIPPGFSDEVESYLDAVSGEDDYERLVFKDVAQLVEGLPHVMVKAAAANAALSLMLERTTP